MEAWYFNPHPPSFPLCSPNAAGSVGSVDTLDDQTETESVVSFRRERPRHRDGMEQHGEGGLPTLLL